ncbi:protein of unknown function - conserved [Leishmania donovani]|uniref:Uncharacterized protein n=4 Tax=Leishmania donovani species complex TaxID=38574 RepID=A4ID97_LEIIN|nr:conserved hypothetical protein [Leishmania infantum JPCM5]CAC9550929.1 hypothetical_protein_-_conserved [Leishmania infantum]CAJ1993693.1 protein of unknown function - conserved [Leishmania donovani]CAM72828.1 conserved hypothetical protein [Leishmania infantum JPCM5]SUZ46699.1 hypothetical_protein_-_conserved [Leishmania infantum]VDZ49514.1 hypothetical_protein_conserved [Leishmania donovani]|eukprot:XP_001469716.1 conserved hypothetical protein [Leishmania infantum JPCM5]
MQTQAHKDVVKNIATASQLEGELQLSEAQHGVAVLDVYNAEWGHCKALSDTFRRLFTDAGDLVHLRFFSVECNAVLESLKDPDEMKPHHPQQKGMVFSKDTLVSFWREMLEKRQNHSKPFFAFYKEGRMRAQLEGIDTPKICRIVRDLCNQQNTVSEYVTNADVLRFWESHFSLSENEVAASEFAHAVQAVLGASAAELSEADLADITAEVQSTSGATVSAADLQSFVGDSGRVKDAILAVVAKKRAMATATAAAPPPPPAEELQPTESEEKGADEDPRASLQRPSSAESGEAVEEAAAGDEEAEVGGEEVDVDADAAQETLPAGEDTAEAASSVHGAPSHNDEQKEELPKTVTDGADEEPVVEPPAVDAAEADEAGADTHELGEPAVANPVEQQAMQQPEGNEADSAYEELPGQQAAADAESPTPSPSLPAEEHGESGVGEASGAPADEARTEDDTQALPGAAENDNQHEELQEDARPPSSAPQPPMDTMEPEDGDDEELGEAPSSAPPADTVNTTGDQDESVVNQIFTNRWVTVTEEEMHVWNTVAALPLHYPQSTTMMADLTNNTTPVHEALSTTADLPTLAEYLTAQGVPYSDINMMCIAADQKVASESLSYGKLSLLLISCDPEEGKGLVPHCETFLKELSDGTLLKHQQPLAFTALALSASVAYPDECFCYCVPETAVAAFQELAVDDIFILNALTPLKTTVPQDGQFILRIIGLPKVIELATTDENEDTMVLSQWYARLRVAEQGAGALTAHFVENVCDDEFQDFLFGYIERLIEDENRLDKKHGDEEKSAEGDFNDEELDDGKSAEVATPEPEDVL